MTDDIDISRGEASGRPPPARRSAAGRRPADALLERGDMGGHAVWLRAVTALDTLLRDRGNHETLH